MRTTAMFAGAACAVVASFAALRSTESKAAAPIASQSASELSSSQRDIMNVLETLALFRNGDESVLAELLATAERCAQVHGRTDTRDFVEFFTRISPTDRLKGLEYEREFMRIYEVVRDIPEGPDPVATWKAQRPQILADLNAVIEASRGAPDCTPAARSLSLRATIMRQRVVEDAQLDDETRKSWMRSGVADAKEALALFERVGALRPRLEALTALAWFDWARGDWVSAQEGFEHVLEVARKVEDVGYQGDALRGMLRLAHESGDLQATARLLDETARLKSPAASWDLTSRHASMLLALDEPERAVEFLTRNRPKTAADSRDWHVLMETTLTRIGDLDSAAAHENVLRASSAEDPVASLAVTEARVVRGEFEEAIAELGDERWNRVKSPSLRLARERLLGTAQLNLGLRTEAIATFERAHAIGDSLEGRLVGADRSSSTASIEGEVVGLETTALLSRARLENGEALQAAVTIEDRQSRAIRSATSGSDQTRIDEASLRAWAAAYEQGLVTWVVGADTTVVVHVARDGTAAGSVLKLGRKTLEDGVRRLREAAVSNDEELARDYAAELQSALFPSAIAARFDSSAGRLLLAAHGPLERLPFDLLALFSPLGTRALVPLVLPGLVDVNPGIALDFQDPLAWSLVGDPIDERGAALLPGVRAELGELAKLHGDPFVRSASRFDRAALSEALASERALHIATHLTSARTRSDSIDTPLAQAAFELSGGARFDRNDVLRARPRLPLAVLSACESAGGEFVDGEAAIGVAKAFLESGTRNLLVTSWPVEDQAARRFTVAFHRALSSGGRPSEAAVAARLTLRSAGAPMSEWAAFRLLGRD